MTERIETHRALDDSFRVAVVMKGLFGLAEVIGGVLLLFVTGEALNNFVVKATRSELSGDHQDFIAMHLLHVTRDLHGRPVFAASYLLSHGVVKVVLVIAMLRNHRWAYPATLAFLAGFVVYQVYRFALEPSIGLVLLTVFDLVVMWLVWREYVVHGAATGSRGPVPSER